ncbi:venom carboxylesterase-6-like isoform X2 [Periplaneta americana]
MVYVHGGGWIAGSSTMYQPHYLLDKDIVLVTFNYRLGPLGFLSTGDAECPGNNGLKDQVAALRWVKDNIAAFGGNPGSVTIFGESAGGASVHYLVLSPMSRGLFHRAISQSGTAFNGWAFAPNGSSTGQAEKLGGLLNCPTQNSGELVACLRSKDAVAITATDKAFMEWSIDPLVPFKPVLEEGNDAFLPATPLELVQNATAVPWMTGVTSEEGSFPVSRFVKQKLIDELITEFDRLAPMLLCYRESSPRKDEITDRIREFYFEKNVVVDNVTTLIDMFTDGWFLHGADHAVELHSAKAAAPVYYYYFTYRGSNTFTSIFGDTSREYGVTHADDLLYLFPIDLLPGMAKPNENDEKMIDILTSLWVNFAHTGNPTPVPFHGVEWPSVSSPANKEYLQIDIEGLEVKQGLLKERTDFWSSLPLEAETSMSAKDEL